MAVEFKRTYKDNALVTLTAKTSKGTFRWWASLSLVDFVPKGRRRYTDQISLREDTQIEALKAIIKLMDRN
jgi:hypothetical protein